MLQHGTGMRLRTGMSRVSSLMIQYVNPSAAASRTLFELGGGNCRGPTIGSPSCVTSCPFSSKRHLPFFPGRLPGRLSTSQWPRSGSQLAPGCGTPPGSRSDGTHLRPRVLPVLLGALTPPAGSHFPPSGSDTGGPPAGPGQSICLPFAS